MGTSAIACAPGADLQKQLREALGSFATGVTVVTTTAPDGRRIGLTANSFTSVSLDPALVLWSLNRRSANLEAFRAATHFAVNVLSAEQQALCWRFARPVEGDRFDGVALAPSKLQLPVLEDSLATFECSKYDQYEAGDHVVFVGRVENFSKGAGDALIFSAGRILSSATAVAL
jgi:3-hydroxy-9,10-secoandrosta-1,3,5(10)-triene-9,17-dione monooxygenase reductase component